MQRENNTTAHIIAIDLPQCHISIAYTSASGLELILARSHLDTDAFISWDDFHAEILTDILTLLNFVRH